jgi:hypothetical protein
MRHLLVLHEESNPTTFRLVRASDADEIIDDRIGILPLDRCFVVHAGSAIVGNSGSGSVPTHASVAGKGIVSDEISFRSSCPLVAVRPEGAKHLWRKNPPRKLSIDLEANERLGRVTERAGAS